MTTELEWWFDPDIWPGTDSPATFPVGTVVCYRIHNASNIVGVVQSSTEEITAVLSDNVGVNPGSTTFKTEDLIAYLGAPLAT